MKTKRKNDKKIPTNEQQQHLQPQQSKPPPRIFGRVYMPSSDNNINNFYNNLIDMAMDKIKRYGITNYTISTSTIPTTTTATASNYTTRHTYAHVYAYDYAQSFSPFNATIKFSYSSNDTIKTTTIGRIINNSFIYSST
jgi:hypothetical protein